MDLEGWAEELDGVFRLSDLRVLYGELSEAGVYKKIRGLVTEGRLMKVKRGVYALPSASLVSISARIDPSAYLSVGTALSRHVLIGSVPARRLQAVKVGVPRTYSCAQGVIEHLSLSPRLFFGFVMENGIRIATPEKAWLDTCYYAYRGRSFPFDLDTDVNRDGLDEARITRYLGAYDPRFRNQYIRNWREG